MKKTKWRHAYFVTGIIKIRAWLESEEGQESRFRSTATTTTTEFREIASRRQSERILSGEAKNYRGNGKKLKTKKGGDFTTKSTYETRYVDILDSDPTVVRFIYEPFKIPYKLGDKNKNYIPDFLVEYSDGHEELIEVKPKKLVDLPINRAKIKAGENHRLIFRVITEADLGL